MDHQIQDRVEALGPAERILQQLTTFTDHLVHNRPGMVTPDPSSPTGKKWEPVIWKPEKDGTKTVYRSTKIGRKKDFERIGTMNGDTRIMDGGNIIGEYRQPGLFWETVTLCYQRIADVYQMDNEFAARWASWSFPRDHRDLKVLLCAFMLVQNRCGEPVKDGDEVLFNDDDYRDVGEAMCLLREGKHDINPKLLVRVGDILRIPEVADINRKLGFGKSARTAPMGRYNKVVTKWLKYREDNPKMLEGLVKAGFKRTVMQLAQRVGYKPQSEKFFEILRWRQKQSKDGRRTMAIGKDVAAAETWVGKSEKEICEIIVKDKPNWKRIVGLLPPKPGMTRAIVAAAVEAGSMSNADLIILTPTLEELGLLTVKAVKDKWKAACDKAENQRAANIARNVKSKEAKEGLQDAADKATEKALEEVTRDMRVYFAIDKSGSMTRSLGKAKEYLAKFLGGFPLDRVHVTVFNTMAYEVNIKSPKAVAVEHAFSNHGAGGGTDYSIAIKALQKHPPKPEEDVLIMFVGDEEDYKTPRLVRAVQDSGLNPVAFGLLKVVEGGRWAHGNGSIVRDAAAQLGIPCFDVDVNMLKSDDPYLVTRMFRDLIAATPVGEPTAGQPARKRQTLVQQIVETPLLVKPVWAS